MYADPQTLSPDPAPDLAAQVRFTYSDAGRTALRRRLIRAVEWVSGQPALRALYLDWAQSARQREESVFDAALRLLGLHLRLSQEEMLARVPASGGLLLVANHPFGIVDGLTIGHLALRLRPRIGIMTNSLLCSVPEVQPHLLPVDFSGTSAARRLTAETRRQAAELLAEGAAVAIFPAGGVATANRPLRGQAVDSAWHPFVGKLATLPGVTTLPMHFSGQNSRLFQIASHTSYPLRVALIFHETRRRMGGDVRVTLGEPIAADLLCRLERGSVADHLRRLTMALANPALPALDEVFIWPSRIKW